MDYILKWNYFVTAVLQSAPGLPEVKKSKQEPTSSAMTNTSEEKSNGLVVDSGPNSPSSVSVQSPDILTEEVSENFNEDPDSSPITNSEYSSFSLYFLVLFFFFEWN